MGYVGLMKILRRCFAGSSLGLSEW